MKILNQIIKLSLLLQLLCVFEVSAQNAIPTVNVNLTMTPPYSPYYADYSGINASKVLLIVQNTSGEVMRIKLSGSLTGDNGVRVWTNSTYVPLSPIVLNPYETKQLNGLALKDVFEVNSLNVLGVNKAELAYTSRIPEGNYTFCIQALDYSTSRSLSATAPLGCTQISVSYPEAPILINPLNTNNVQITNPQSVIFNWINQGIVPAGIQYKLEIIELPEHGRMDPNQALNAATFPLIGKTLNTTSYVMSPSDPPLKNNTKYAWRVKAVDPSGRTIFKNNGVSQAYTFTYGSVDKLDLLKPYDKTKFNKIQNIEFNWTYNGSVDPNDMYELYVEREKVRVSPIKIQTKNLSLEVKNNVQLQEFLKVEGNYKWSLKHISSGRQSDTRSFEVKYDQAVGSYSLSLSGALNYQFNEDHFKKDAVPHFLANTKVQVIQIKTLIPIFRHKSKIEVVENGVKKTYEQEVDSIPNYFDLSNNPTGQLMLSSVKVLTETMTNKDGRLDVNVQINPTEYTRSSKVYTYNGQPYVEVVGLAMRINDNRFSDPNWFFYPSEAAVTTYGLPTTTVQIYAYNLSVNFSALTQNNMRGTLYLLKNKQQLFSGEVQNIKGQTKDVPLIYSTWTTSGKIGQLPVVTQSYKDKFVTYDVVGSLPFDKNVIGGKNVSSSAKFNKLVNSLSDADGNYELYFEPIDAQNSVYFSPISVTNTTVNSYGFVSTVFGGIIRQKSIEIGPKYVSMTVKGRYLYKWKSDGAKGVSKPLPKGTKLVLSRGRLSKVAGGAQEIEMLDEVRLTTAVVGENGEYAFKVGYVDYEQFNKNDLELIISMESSRYFTAEPFGFAYNKEKDIQLRDLVAHVREMKFTSQILNDETKKTINQMMVYLCREKGKTPLLIPNDEGDPKRSTYFKKVFSLNGVDYDIISQVSTAFDGSFTFDRVVTPEDVKDDYIILAEPDNKSDKNYASTRIFNASNVIRSSAIFPEIKSTPYDFNSSDLIRELTYKGLGMFKLGVLVSPLDPYITGAVHPYSTSAVKVIEGAKVELFDLTPDMVSKIKAAKNPSSLFYKALFFGKTPIQTETTGSNGRFEFKIPLQIGNFSITQTGKLIKVSKPGFQVRYSLVQDGIPLAKGQRVNFDPYYLELPKDIIAEVVDQNGTPVAARIVVGDDFSWADTQGLTALKTASNGVVSLTTILERADLKSPDGEVVFTVIPKNRAKYKTTEIKKTITKSGETFKLVVDDNSHDIIVNCIDESTGTSLFADIYITNIHETPTIDKFAIGSRKIHTVSFKASGNNFDMRVVPVGNYTIAKTSFYSDEAKQETITVYVRPARTINLTATYTTAGRSGKNPFKYGEYNVDIKGLDKDEYVTSAYNVNAGVTLSKVPSSAVLLVVSKAKYVGEEKTIGLRSTGVQDFNLQYLGDGFLDNFYDFPIAITKVSEVGNKITLSGMFDPKGKISTSTLSLSNSNSKLRFEDVVVTRIGQGLIQSYNVPTVTFVDNELEGQLHGKFKIKVQNSKGLQLVPENNKASILGNVSLDPNSLANGIRTSSDAKEGVESQLFLNKKGTKYTTTGINTSATNWNAQVTSNGLTTTANTSTSPIKSNSLRTFSTGISDLTDAELLVSNINLTKPSFKLVDDFVVTSDEDLLLTHAGIKFNGVLSTNLSYAADRNINQKVKVEILNNKYSVSDTKPFKLKLNNWLMEFSNWSVSSQGFEGQGYINAFGLTIPFKRLKMTYNEIGYAGVEVKSLKLLNVWPVTFNADVMTSFGYDKGYTKEKGAWSIAVLGKSFGTELASISNLPDLHAADKIKIQNINLYDTGDAKDTKITLVENHPDLTLNNIAKFKPLSIFGGPDYISIKGSLDLEIPNVNGFQGATYDLKYKMAESTPGNGVFTFNHVHDESFKNITFNGKGVKIAFSGSAKDQKFNAKDGLIMQGVLTDIDLSSEYAINVELKKTAEKTDIVLSNVSPSYKNIYFNKNKTGAYLANSDAKMNLTDGKWDDFTFEGDMTGAEGVNAKSSHLKFVVKGDVVANNSKIGIENMSPEGMNGLNLTYDFKEKAILGSVTGIKQSTPFADFIMDVDLRIDSREWYIFSNAIADNVKHLPILNKVGAGIIVGNTTTSALHMASLRKHYRNDDVPENFMTNFSKISGIGVVMSADLKLPILPSFNLDLSPVAKCDVNYGAYANVYFNTKLKVSDPLNSSMAIGARVGAYVQLGVSASVGLACAGVNLGAEAYVDLEGKLETLTSMPDFAGRFKFILKGDAYVGAGVCNNKCQTPCWDAGLFEICSPVPCIRKSWSGNMTLGLGARWENNKFIFDTALTTE